ncbi:OmpA family protein [Flavobacteriaceae bacterium F89]|uniref:OmpA family protein n=1 Tax=Cerina litoralis TaxID=2874477 RepID=A0AAE3EX18_9FLAO|nr:OmpA family protein [Cerina litoralis]MCG2461868.1 OmpA family protein [Cerina litoralis]
MIASLNSLKISSVIFLLCSIFAWGQNLVRNPSFEDYNACPDNLGSFNSDLIYWSTPSLGSTDYFNACSSSMGIPDNFNGSQASKFGHGYAGMYLYAPGDYREYMQAELTQNLIKGARYTLSFYLCRAEKSDFSITDLGVVFSEEKIDLSIKKELSKMQLSRIKENRFHWVNIANTKFYSNSDEWVLVTTEFTATGIERFMTLGNFKSNRATRLKKIRGGSNKGAYYYVDMVSLVKISEKGYLVDKPQILETLFFEFDKYELPEASIEELNDLYAILQEDTSIQLEINGYTDNVGSDSYNESLSKKRAKAVATYLLGLGLKENRVQWNGLGGTNPIHNNDTPEGRKKNRRVEFVFTKLP